MASVNGHDISCPYNITVSKEINIYFEGRRKRRPLQKYLPIFSLSQQPCYSDIKRVVIIFHNRFIAHHADQRQLGSDF